MNTNVEQELVDWLIFFLKVEDMKGTVKQDWFG
jgi:hypothetical protein